MRRFFGLIGIAVCTTLILGADAPAPPDHLFLEGVINEETVDPLIAQIRSANRAGLKRIVLEINSPGGVVDDGFRLVKAIERSKAPVICVVDGDAASMAFYLLQSCTDRVMTKRSTLMAHGPALGGNFYGRANDWKAIADYLRISEDALIEHMVHRMKMTVPEFKAKIEHGDWWMGWAEAFDVAAVDRVVIKVTEA